MRIQHTTGRRQSLRNCLAGSISFTAKSGSIPREATRSSGAPAKSRAWIAHDPLLPGSLTEHPGQAGGHRSSLPVDQGRMANLLDRAMRGLFDSADPSRCWAKVAGPRQLVDVKVNSLGGPGLSRNVQLMDTICERLQRMSIALKNMYGAIHNPNKYHRNGCDPFAADLNILPDIRATSPLRRTPSIGWKITIRVGSNSWKPTRREGGAHAAHQ